MYPQFGSFFLGTFSVDFARPSLIRDRLKHPFVQGWNCWRITSYFFDTLVTSYFGYFKDTWKSGGRVI